MTRFLSVAEPSLGLTAAVLGQPESTVTQRSCCWQFVIIFQPGHRVRLTNQKLDGLGSCHVAGYEIIQVRNTWATVMSTASVIVILKRVHIVES